MLNATTSSHAESVATPCIDRKTASKLNPLIGMSSPETFDRCRVIVRDLGYIMSAGEHLDMPPDMSNWYQMFEAVSAAMSWEIEAMEIERDRQDAKLAELESGVAK